MKAQSLKNFTAVTKYAFKHIYVRWVLLDGRSYQKICKKLSLNLFYTNDTYNTYLWRKRHIVEMGYISLHI